MIKIDVISNLINVSVPKFIVDVLILPVFILARGGRRGGFKCVDQTFTRYIKANKTKYSRIISDETGHEVRERGCKKGTVKASSERSNANGFSCA